MMGRSPVVDAQVHIWGPDTPQRPWPRAGAGGRTAEPHRAEPLLADELIREMDGAGVDRAVIVPPSWEGERNDLALAAAARWPDRFAVMGRIDPGAEDVEARMARWRGQPGALGLRLLLGGELDWLGEARGEAFWAAAERQGLPLMLAPRGEMGLIDQVAARHPGLRLVVDHMAARVHRTGDAAFVDLDALIALAARPNVAVKATAAPCYSAEAYPYRDLHGRLRRMFDAFGPRRMFWGSDLSRLPCPYGQCLSLFTQELDWLGGEDLEWVMGRGVIEWLRWG